jgi:hypothetical protein
VLAEIVQPQWLRLPDQVAQDAVPRRQVPNGPDVLLIDSHSDEVAQAAVLRNHTHRTVLRTHKVTGRPHQAVQHRFKAQILGEGDDGGKQAVHPFLGLQQLICTGNKVPKEILGPFLHGRAPRLSAHVRPPVESACVVAGPQRCCTRPGSGPPATPLPPEYEATSRDQSRRVSQGLKCPFMERRISAATWPPCSRTFFPSPGPLRSLGYGHGHSCNRTGTRKPWRA